ncbi:efflux RND transporter periplasmic adaptor subunit [Aquicoccus sp.]|uniref:efflux RND transporter periplasmic adaptor subunit n=1 Tax=Aquicoccus sp. TaxID=2055851 RepID=UPI0035690BDC
MPRKRNSRVLFTALAVAVLVGALVYAFWPRPVLVDIGTVERRPMHVTIDEEGRTQVHNTFVVSTPVAGRLMRVTAQPGDRVEQGKTVVARMLPISPSALDARTREQANANVTAADAALRVAQADMNRALADQALAEGNLERTRRLFENGIASKAALERDETALRLAQANVDTARAAISMRIAELNNAQAQLIGFDDQGLARAIANRAEEATPLRAPTDGVILRIMQESETTLSAGTPVMEIGNVSDDLEIVAELLSTDAVRIEEGAPVIIENWGGENALEGEVKRVDPWGFTKFSALGVEEQRVRVTIGFLSPIEAREGLGHGFRVEVRIVVWETGNALTVPASSLFRSSEDWAVFHVTPAGRIEKRIVKVAANNNISAAIADGLSEGERIVIYPSATLSDGVRVAQRRVEGR